MPSNKSNGKFKYEYDQVPLMMENRYECLKLVFTTGGSMYNQRRRNREGQGGALCQAGQRNVPSMNKSDLIVTNIAISINKSALLVNKIALSIQRSTISV